MTKLRDLKQQPATPPELRWLRLDASQPLRFRKEAIPVGQWKKLDADGSGVAFETFQATLEHWRSSVEELRANGITIPLSMSHDGWEDTGNKLGEVVGAIVQPNEDGLDSLYLDIQFDNEQSRDVGLKGDISIGSPPEWYDGKGRKYTFPLRHVASTTAPVIPGLEPWQAIAAAFGGGPSNRGKPMLDDILAALEIQAPEGADDNAKQGLILGAISALKGGGKPADKPADAPADGTVNADEADKGGKKAEPVVPKLNLSQASPLVVKTIRDAREAQLNALVDSHQLTPAAKKEIMLAFCDDKQIGLELSENGDGKQFDRILAIVKANKPLAATGRSEAVDDDAAIELSHAKGDCGLVENMKKRAEAAKATA